MGSPTDGGKDGQMNGTDENYIPLWHTSYAGGINSFLRYALDKKLSTEGRTDIVETIYHLNFT